MQGRLKLTKLILAGENKKDAIINFKGGLNVIAEHLIQENRLLLNVLILHWVHLPILKQFQK